MSWFKLKKNPTAKVPHAITLNARARSERDINLNSRHVRFWSKGAFAPQKVMSALPPKADMCGALAHVCFGPKAGYAASFVLTRKRQSSPEAAPQLIKFDNLVRIVTKASDDDSVVEANELGELYNAFAAEIVQQQFG